MFLCCLLRSCSELIALFQKCKLKSSQNFSSSDNAYDPDVNAKQIWIDKTVINNDICLTFTDNGNGMTSDKLHKMLRYVQVLQV